MMRASKARTCCSLSSTGSSRRDKARVAPSSRSGATGDNPSSSGVNRRTTGCALASSLGAFFRPGGRERQAKAESSSQGGGILGSLFGKGAPQPRDFVQSGMAKFLAGDVKESVEDFDRALDLDER